MHIGDDMNWLQTHILLHDPRKKNDSCRHTFVYSLEPFDCKKQIVVAAKVPFITIRWLKDLSYTIWKMKLRPLNLSSSHPDKKRKETQYYYTNTRNSNVIVMTKGRWEDQDDTVMVVPVRLVLPAEEEISVLTIHVPSQVRPTQVPCAALLQL